MPEYDETLFAVDAPERPDEAETADRHPVGTGLPAQRTSSDRYALVGEIACGGMGVVYRAVDRTLNRDIAVKVLQRQFALDPEAVRRFFDEARIAAQLQHPGIPPVHDLGTLPDGRPFLAMKLIKGRTLDALLAERSDASAERGRFVAAFEQICQAVAYAHAHQVIHRDLKPQNVMVGSFGEVQVMDWGLAKVLLGGREEMTDPEPIEPATEVRSLRQTDGSATEAGSVLGTPAYMPPEQAAGAVGKVDASSDVFGLGAILAVILTGQPPFGGGSAETIRVKAAQAEVYRCFAQLDSCGAEPELVSLCKHCLAPRQNDRPADAGEVARAVGRLRAAADERARRAESERAAAEVRSAEQAKRRRVWLVLAASLFVALVAAVVLTVRADESRRGAEKARAKAEEQTRLANDVKDFLKFDMLELADPAAQQRDSQVSGLAYDADLRLRDVVIRASTAIDGKFPTQPLVEAELRFTIGSALRGMGRMGLAIPQFERARALQAEHLGPDARETLASANALADCYHRTGRREEAVALLEGTLRSQEVKLGRDHPDTLETMNNLANGYHRAGRNDEALKLYEETLRGRTAKLGTDHPDTLRSMNNLANSLSHVGRHDEAMELRERTLESREATLGRDHPDTFRSMNNLSNSYHEAGRDEDALKLREETLRLRKARLGADHPETLSSMQNLSRSYVRAGRRDEALKLREETLRLRIAKLGADHPDTLISMKSVADSYLLAGRPADGLALLEKTTKLLREKVGADNPDTLESMQDLAAAYHRSGRLDDALGLHAETLRLRTTRLGAGHPDTLRSMGGEIEALVALNRPSEALGRIDELFDLAARAEGKRVRIDPDLKPTMLRLRLIVLRDRKDIDGCRETAAMWEKIGGKGAKGLYLAACMRSMTAELLKADSEDAGAETALAMDRLRKAAAAGFRDRTLAEKDRDLDALRQREDFRELMNSLSEVLPKPKER